MVCDSKAVSYPVLAFFFPAEGKGLVPAEQRLWAAVPLELGKDVRSQRLLGLRASH